MRVYHRRGAGRPIRVVWTLEEVGASYEIVVLTSEETAADEHRSRHPLGRVPVLEDQDGLLFESSALCLQIADRGPDLGLMPAVGTHDRALVYQWAFFAMTEIEPPAIESLRHRERSPEIADAAGERARDAVQVIEDALHGRDYLVGAGFTVADIIASSVVRVAAHVGAYEPRDRLADYLAVMEARPARQCAEGRLA